MKKFKKVKPVKKVNQLSLLHLLYEDPTIEDHAKHFKPVEEVKEAYTPAPFR